ncbi:MAG: gluconate:H+ symporter [bacterium]
MDINTLRIILSASIGIILLLILIIKIKLNPFLSLIISALFIGLGAGLDISTLSFTVQEGAGKTLQGVVLLIGLGSMFGGILDASGGAKSLAQTLIDKFGESKAAIALGVTGLIVGTTVFFEAGVMILMPIAFGLSKKTGKSALYFAIPLLAGLATSFAFIPPSAGSILVAGILGVDLGLMILVGVPVGIISLVLAGILFSKFIGSKIDIQAPEIEDEEQVAELPSFKTVLFVILLPLVLILINTICSYFELPVMIAGVVQFLGTPFISLIIAILAAMYLLGKKQGYDMDKIKSILETSLKPTASILLVIAGGGIISEVLQVIGIGDMIATAMQSSGLPIIIIAFLLAALVRICAGAAVVAMTLTASILIGIPEVATLDPMYLVAMVIAINAGSSILSHFNDSGFWLVNSVLGMTEKDTLKSWTVMSTIIALTGFACSIIIVLFV